MRAIFTPLRTAMLAFARYRHDKPNLGSARADAIGRSGHGWWVELRLLRALNVFCDGRHMRKPASAPGALALYDLRKSWSADLREPFDNLSVYLPHSSLRDFAAEGDSSFVELRYDIEHVIYDDVMLHLVRAIMPVLERPHEVRTIYLDSLFLAIRDHIASTYGTFSRATAGKKQGLTARQLQHALEYIEVNLSEDVSLRELAEVCTASTSSIVRGFKSSLGVSPHRLGDEAQNCTGAAPDVRRRNSTQRDCNFLRVRGPESLGTRVHAPSWNLSRLLAAQSSHR